VKESHGSDREEERAEAYLPLKPKLPSSSAWIRVAVLLGAVAFIAIFFFTDLRALWQTLTSANPWILPLPILFVALSYLTMALSYQGICAAADHPVPLWDMLKITLIANSINYLLATGGLSGFAVRMYFFTRLSIPSGTAVVISLAQTFLTNVSLLAFVLCGFLFLFTSNTLQGAALVAVSVLLVLAILAALVAILLLARPRLRRRTLFFLGHLVHWIIVRVVPHRSPPRTHIWRHVFNLNRGIEFLLARRRQMVAPLLYILIDWVFTILILYSSFLAVRYVVPVSYVIVGFTVGIIISFTTLIPGGLGIMEGSMAAIFAGFGVPFETAVVATLLFRVAYYLIPVLVSAFFLHGMFVLGSSISKELRENGSTES
jgi:glycosyltransferase 2 family protein